MSIPFLTTKNPVESKFLIEAIAKSEQPDRIRTIKDPEGDEPFVYAVKFYAPNVIKDPDFRYLSELRPDILAALRENRAVLVLDTSNEGAKFKPKHFEVLHARLRALEVPAAKVLYLTQNIVFEGDYKAWAAKQAVEPIEIATYHYFLRMMANHVTSDMIPSGDYAARRAAAVALAERNAARPKTYLSLNFTPRAHRVGTMLHILARGLLDKGTVSFPGLANRKTDLSGRIEALMDKEPFPNIDELMTHLDALIAITPLTLDVDPFARISPVIDTGDFRHYTDTYFSLVTESGTAGKGHRRFTEKPFKPVLGLHPFIIIGLPQTLEIIRSYGFKTFSPAIDESYDTIIDDCERVTAALEEFERICALPPEPLAAGYTELLPVILHNYDQFDGPLQRHFVEAIETPLLARIDAMRLASAPASG